MKGVWPEETQMKRYAPAQLIAMRDACRSACNTINSKTAQNTLIEAADMFAAMAVDLENALTHACELNVAMDGVCMRCGTRVFEPSLDAEAGTAGAPAAEGPSSPMDDEMTPIIRAAQREKGYWRSYGERALPWVSNRHSKASLCHLVNALLMENEKLRRAAGPAEGVPSLPGAPGPA